MTELPGTQFTLERTTRTPVQSNRVFDNRAVHSYARGCGSRRTMHLVPIHDTRERLTKASPRTR
jgi:hypothetical protein